MGFRTEGISGEHTTRKQRLLNEFWQSHKEFWRESVCKSYALMLRTTLCALPVCCLARF